MIIAFELPTDLSAIIGERCGKNHTTMTEEIIPLLRLVLKASRTKQERPTELTPLPDGPILATKTIKEE